MNRFTCIAAAVATISLCSACTESIQRVRPIPIDQASPASTGNRAPRIRSVAIQPVEPGPGDSLACIAMASDAEDDAIEFDYRWQIDGRSAGVGDTLIGPFFRGQSVTCSAIPRDGSGLGAAVRSAAWVVAPAPRVVARVSIEPPTADEHTALRCGVIAPSEARIGWFVNDVQLPNANRAELAAGRAKTGDRVRCRVELDGLAMESEARIIGAERARFAQLTSLPSAP